MPCQDVATGEWRHINHALAVPGASPTPATDIRRRRDFSLFFLLFLFLFLLFFAGLRIWWGRAEGQCCLPLFLLSWITPTQECNQTTQPASMRGRRKREKMQRGGET